ncbi:MAG: hypothetical protein A3G33_04255 [Omnitrophica bacterium RIFCSPLOWO2_12_FULL_44_17]|uniref:DUF2061 domain-containing protein n=1 Tax=Candidatus Danuiimicrobium aquiferis TaxID=1801832 RepID=A0A1G1KQD6_9BACT|nr:MAG: hypothetical protein A3B72_10465 [Omnitrophica bacterium RIFCSPHIGHO2_02_FULL_45_28]OGW89536.1 MAG: hypothetical protein A3E74_07935 [Omnitrophica bacterium RIFCSPHIGHO2_12_FULL_44_12]OGW95150.1 MAG: hypothetical protein A3G33_04255 [Omnitrophica bacterium RIFCSPLOWO2_12_FULL_44_17]OGX01705.1 MAG: hypothetical protein A3J12_04180 [Omnitrophica bacterium RIFCSPLOWO2_02_FULL_44_11]
MKQVEERKRRSILKAISWRTTGTIDTIIVSWIISGKFNTAISIGCVELFTKIFLYYFHERIWNKIRFGQVVKDGEYSI